MSETEPQLQRREAQPYLAIHAHVTSEAEFRHAADTGFPALFAWLGERGVEPGGPVFIRYVADSDDIELGVPVAPGVAGGEVGLGLAPVGPDVEERGPAPGRQLTGLHPLVAGHPGRDRHAELDVVGVGGMTDEDGPGGVDAVLAQPPEQRGEAGVGRVAELRLARHVRVDRKAGLRRSSLQLRFMCAHAG